MLLGLIVWYLIGIISFLVCQKIYFREVCVRDFLASFVIGVLGPVFLIIVFIGTFVDWVKTTKILDKRLF
jgi:hypothetical protein